MILIIPVLVGIIIGLTVLFIYAVAKMNHYRDKARRYLNYFGNTQRERDALAAQKLISDRQIKAMSKFISGVLADHQRFAITVNQYADELIKHVEQLQGENKVLENALKNTK